MTTNNADPLVTQQTVEQFGVRIGAARGWPRMAGRMLATLMLRMGPMTTDELREALGASAGAISESSRLLIKGGVIRKIKIPGRRKRSYVYRDDAWNACLQHSISNASELRGLAESAASSADGRPAEILSRFHEMRAFYTSLGEVYSRLEHDLKEKQALSGSSVDGKV